MQILQIFTLVLVFLHRETEARIFGGGSCSNDPCGFLQVRVNRNKNTGCETKCVSRRKVDSMLSQGWACGKCPPQQCFDTKVVLETAVDFAISNPGTAEILFADTYGWPVGKWCFTSNLKDMSGLFENAVNFNEDLSGWDTSSVTNMGRMFAGAQAFNGSVNTWDVSRVKDMSFMFNEAFNFNQDVSGWDTSSVTNMRRTFRNAQQFNVDISTWDVSKVTNMENMLYNCYAFKQNLCKWGNHLAGKTVNMFDMWGWTPCPSQGQPDLSANPPGPFCYVC